MAETPDRHAGPSGRVPSSPTGAVPEGYRAGAVVDRAAAFAGGPPRFPGKVIVVAVVAFVVLGLGGVVLDHLFPGPVGAATSTTTGDYPPPLSTGPGAAPPPGPPTMAQLPARTSALMGLEGLDGSRAPNLRLVDQYDRSSSLEGFRGKVVLLSFFDATCNDICPVLEDELAGAYRDLGRDGARVEVITVNTDPLALTWPAARPGAERAMSSVHGWRFLTGPLAQIGPVWTEYGISVQVQRSTKTVSHNDLLYFIDTMGRWRLRATPFADESSSGSFSLPRATEREWASGIAMEAKSIMGPGI